MELSYRDLLHAINALGLAQEAGGGGAAAAMAVRASLRGFGQRLLRFPPRAASSLERVRSLKVNVGGAEIKLSEFDVAAVEELAATFELDEVACVSLLLAARGEGDAGRNREEWAAAGAGIYIEERFAALKVAKMLLHASAAEESDGGDGLIAEAGREMLQGQGPGGERAIKALAESARKGLNGGQGAQWNGSSLGWATIETGKAPLDVLHAREVTVICESLAIAVPLQRMMGSGPDAKAHILEDARLVVDLLPLAEARARESNDPVAAQQSSLVVMAIIGALVPLGTPQGEEILASMGTDAQIRHAIMEVEAPPQANSLVEKVQARALVQLAYGVMLGTDTSIIENAITAGALKYATESIIRSATFQDEEPGTRLQVARTLHSLIIALLHLPAGRQAVQRMRAGVDPSIRARPEDRGLPSFALPQLLELLAGVSDTLPSLSPSDATISVEALLPFLEHVRSFSTASVSVMVPFLHLLRSLSASDTGMKVIFDMMKGEARDGMVTWHLLFTTLQQYCFRFSKSYNDEDNMVDHASGGQSMSFSAMNQQPEIASDDAEGLSAFLSLLAAVWEESRTSDMERWCLHLTESFGFHPLESLYQLVMHPVPLPLKAALFNAISSFVHDGASAAMVWRGLETCGGVGENTLDFPTRGRGFHEGIGAFVNDSIKELKQVETPSENYCRTIAFVDLLNKLIRTAPLPDDGVGYGRYTAFVKNQVFVPFALRTYRDEREKWRIATGVMDHFMLILKSYRVTCLSPNFSGKSRTAITSAGEKALGFPNNNERTTTEYILDNEHPGFALMLDLMQESDVRRTIFSVIEVGVTGLCHHRAVSESGADMEMAVLGALRLLRLAMLCDEAVHDKISQNVDTAFIELVDGAFIRDRRRLATILEYVRYPHNPAVQLAALRVASVLFPRLNDPLELLSHSGDNRTAHIVEGMTLCLRHALSSDVESGYVDDEFDDIVAENAARIGLDAGSSGSDCAELLLQVLISSLEIHPCPGIAHMAFGYRIDAGPDGVEYSHLSSRQGLSCVRSLLEAIRSDLLLEIKTSFYDLCLRIVHVLASNEVSGPPMLELLHREFFPWFANEKVPKIIDFIGDTADSRDPSATFVAAHALNICALVLHTSDADLILHRQNLELLLGVLFTCDDGESALTGDMVDADTSVVSDALERACFEIEETADFAPQDVARWKVHLDDRIEKQVDSFMYESNRGSYQLVDLRILAGIVLREYNDASMKYNLSGNTAEHKALKEAARQILRRANMKNKCAHEDAGQLAMISAWRVVTTVGCTRRFDVLCGVLEGVSSDAFVSELLNGVLTKLNNLPLSRTELLAPHLCQVTATLLAKLREVSGPTTSISNSSTAAISELPRIASSILAKLLEALLAKERTGMTRQLLYSALLSLLHYAGAPSESELPLGVLNTVIDMDSGVDFESRREQDSAVTARSLFTSYRAVESMTGKMLCEVADPLMAVLTRDASNGTYASRILAYHAAASLFNLTSTEVQKSMLNSVEESGLITLCLEEIRMFGSISGSSATTYRSAPASSLVLNAVLTLVLNIVVSDPYCLERMVWAGLLNSVVSCRALRDNVVENGRSDSFAEYRRCVVLPLLRILMRVMSALPNSSEVLGHASEFFTQNQRYMNRILAERSSDPSLHALEEVNLVVSFCSILATAEFTTPAEQSSPTEHPEIFTYLDALSIQHFVTERGGGESKYAREVRRRKQAGESESRDTIMLECALTELQCLLMKHLRVSVTSCHFSLSVLTSTSGSQREKPSLQLIGEVIEEAVNDLESLWERQALLFEEVKTVEKSRYFLTPNNKEDAPYNRPDIQVASLQAGIFRHKERYLYYLIENGLDLLHTSLKDSRATTGEFHAAIMAPTDAFMSPSRSLTTSSQDTDRLAKRLKPLLDRLICLVNPSRSQSTDYVHLLSRRLLRIDSLFENM